MINKKIVVLGNGPSLKKIDLRSLSSIDTLGMNAAYRYWERIDWYPTHYVCLDDQLIETHASAINDLIVKGKVKTAFLIAKILDYYPDLVNHPKVFFLESFNHTRQKRVVDTGIPFIPSTSFCESDASKVTTGSYSVRFAAFLGYDEISILGIDLRYVEIISEAKSTEGIKLEMVSTPRSNPNYFFDDYQRAGDKYNIPNPAAHDGNLHVKSFQVMVHDIEKFGWDVKVYNSNPESILEDKKILPLMPLKDFLPLVNMKPTQESTLTKKLFIAGNGPSLKEVDFDNLRNIDWLGMNAAYRYWDEIGVYPTYYCCLDKVVVKEHATEIKRLLDNKNVQSAFLIKAVLEVEPDLENYNNVYFLEDLEASDCVNTEIFKTPFSSKKTTGSWAIRFTIFLGYTDIYISGIDCNYVEVVSGAKLTGNELELQIEDDSAENPNYFFKGYQKKGDKYQIPNPENHFGNMHLQSLEAVAIDVMRYYPNVKITNTTKESNLYKYDVFPYLQVRRVFGQAALDAIVIPMIRQEVDTLLNNFELWTDRGFQPVSLPNNNSGGVYLHVVFDCKVDEEVVNRIEQEYSQNYYLQTVFEDLRITFLNIPSNLNHYIRDGRDKTSIRKSGPNVHALATFECLANTYNTIFYMEVDNTPVQQGWLDILNNYCFENTFLIAGAVLSDLGNIDPALSLHINGNALYRIGEKRFASLLSEVFYPGIKYLICDRGYNHIAYDCLISTVLSLTLSARHRRELGEPIAPEIRELSEKLQPYLSLFTPFPAFVNIPPGSEGDLNQLLKRYLIKRTDALVVHNKAFNDEVNKMRMQLFSNGNMDSNEIFKSKFCNSHFNPISNNQLSPFHYFNTRNGMEVDYIDYARGLLVVRGDELNCVSKEMLTKGLSIVVDASGYGENTQLKSFLELKSSDDLDIEFRFARHGEGEFCQTYKKIKALKDVSQKIELPLVLKDSYKALRLVVSPHNSFTKMTLRFRIVSEQGTSINNKRLTTYSVEEKCLVSVIQKFETIALNYTKGRSTKVNDSINGKLGVKLAKTQVPPEVPEAIKTQQKKAGKGKKNKKVHAPIISEIVVALAENDHKKLDSVLCGIRDSYLPSLYKALMKSPKFKWLLPSLESYTQVYEGEFTLPQIVYIDPVHRNTVSATQELRKRLLERYPSKKVTLIHPCWSKKGSWELTVAGKNQVLPMEQIISYINTYKDAKVLVRTGFLGEIGTQLYTELLKVDHKIIALVMDTWDIRLKNDTSKLAKVLMASFVTLLNKAESTLCITDDMANYMVNTYSIKNPGTIHNFIPHAQFERMKSTQPIHKIHDGSRQLTYLYSGGLEDDMTFGGLLDFIKVVAADETLKQHVKLVVKTFQRHELQAKRVIEECKKYSIEHHVISKDLVKAEYNEMVRQSDVYFIPYVDSKSSSEYVLYSYPNKFTDYLENQKPIVYFGPDYAINRIITELNIDGIYSVSTAENLKGTVKNIDNNYDKICHSLKAETSNIIANFGEAKILSNFYEKII